MFKYLNPYKYYQFARRKYFNFIYDAESDLIEINKSFANLGLNLEEAQKSLVNLRSRKDVESEAMESIHWTLFSAISIKDKNIKSILEIGTYNGVATKLLSELFPHAKIKTVDLPETDPLFCDTYQRESDEKVEAFKTRRNKNISHPNISYYAVNSIFLPQIIEGEKFDLIWADGGHLFPEIAWDISHAYSHLATSGWLLVDDVYTHPKAPNDGYGGPDTFKVVNYLKARTSLKMELVLKRVGASFSSDPKRKKYVAVLRH
jgi:hypothetical protein